MCTLVWHHRVAKWCPPNIVFSSWKWRIVEEYRDGFSYGTSVVFPYIDFKNIALNDRICSFCSTNEVEDETHFMLCFMLYDLKYQWLLKVKQETTDFDSLNMQHKLNIVFTKNYHCTAKLLLRSFNLRKDKLYMYSFQWLYCINCKYMYLYCIFTLVHMYMYYFVYVTKVSWVKEE